MVAQKVQTGKQTTSLRQEIAERRTRTRSAEVTVGKSVLPPRDRARLLASLDLRFQPQQIRKERWRASVLMAAQRSHLLLKDGGKRTLDLGAASLFLLALSPVLLCLTLAGRLRKTAKLGRRCEPYTEYSFELSPTGPGRLLRAIGVQHLPAMINIIKGELSFVGPRSATSEELTPRERAVRKRAEVRPGLFCLWGLRRRSNINFTSELDTDAEYVETSSLKGDLGIVLRGLPTLLYGDQGVAPAADVRIFNIPIDNVTMGDVLGAVKDRIDRSASTRLCFVNADCANLAYRDAGYLRSLQTADLVVADGIGMKLAGKLLRQEICQNVNGTDLFPRLCDSLNGTGRGIFLFGGRPGVAEGVRAWVESNHPGVVISGCQTGFFSPEEEEAVIQKIADSGASVLLVALGAPRQDQWIEQNQQRCEVPVAMGVGGLFDFYSGMTPRAPQWVRELGMEWFFRFVQEPDRLWKRYLVGNVVFLTRVLWSRLAQRRSAERPDAYGSHSHSGTRV